MQKISFIVLISDSLLFSAHHKFHPQYSLHRDPLWTSVWELMLLLLPGLNPMNTHSETRTSYSAFLYSEDNTVWTQSPTESAIDLNRTISIFHFFWHEKLLFYPLVLWFHSQNFIPIETLCFNLPLSCVNSSVSLIWDVCYLLRIFSQDSEKPRQCSVNPCELCIENINHHHINHFCDPVSPTDTEDPELEQYST